MTGAKRPAAALHSYSAKEYSRETIKENVKENVIASVSAKEYGGTAKEYSSVKEYGIAGNSIPFSGGLSAACRGSPGMPYAQQQQQQQQQVNNYYDCQAVGTSKKSRQSVLIPSASALAASMQNMGGSKSSLWR